MPPESTWNCCPGCGKTFRLRRLGKRCPRCGAVLVREGEGYTNDRGDRVFLRGTEGWFEVMEP